MLLRLKGGGHRSSRRGLRVAGERFLLQHRLAAGSYCVTSRQGRTFLLRAVVAGRQAIREVGGQEDRQKGSRADRKLWRQGVRQTGIQTDRELGRQEVRWTGN